MRKAIVLAFVLAACEPILSNNGFDLWCGDSLCSWDVEKGDIARVSTWHPDDHGVELVGPEVVLSQIDDSTWWELSCVRIEALVDVEGDAQLTVGADLDNDGTIDASSALHGSDFAPTRAILPLPGTFEGIRFVLSKRGPGRVRLAQLRAYDCADPGDV